MARCRLFGLRRGRGLEYRGVVDFGWFRFRFRFRFGVWVFIWCTLWSICFIQEQDLAVEYLDLFRAVTNSLSARLINQTVVIHFPPTTLPIINASTNCPVSAFPLPGRSTTSAFALARLPTRELR